MHVLVAGWRVDPDSGGFGCDGGDAGSDCDDDEDGTLCLDADFGESGMGAEADSGDSSFFLSRRRDLIGHRGRPVVAATAKTAKIAQWSWRLTLGPFRKSRGTLLALVKLLFQLWPSDF